MAERERQRQLVERLTRKERIEEYWRGKRLEIRMEGVRDGLSNLNLSTELVDVEMGDHKLMDRMMDMTGAVVSMERSELSLGMEEQFMDALMHSVMGQAEMMDTSNHIGDVMGTDNEDWPDDFIFMDRNFEQWVEDEMLDM